MGYIWFMNQGFKVKTYFIAITKFRFKEGVFKERSVKK